LIEQVLDDHATAPIDEKLRATLGLLKTMTLEHERLGPDDIRAVMRAGVSKTAIREALEVAFLFNIYDRLADAMGWDVPSRTSGYYEVGAKRLLGRGYHKEKARSI
jgi:alkylhydroperoxidase family enzyme